MPAPSESGASARDTDNGDFLHVAISRCHVLSNFTHFRQSSRMPPRRLVVTVVNPFAHAEQS